VGRPQRHGWRVTSFEQFTGTTANLLAATGGPTSNLRALEGLKVWLLLFDISGNTVDMRDGAP
jgi:hypothetical protein